jgi:hypothetical protein
MTTLTFQDAYRLAVDQRDTRPLADYVETAATLTASERRQLANLLRDLRRRGRGEHGPPREKRERQSEGEAIFRLARQSADRMRLWRHDNDASRVPLAVRNQIINDDIDAGIASGLWPATWRVDRRRNQVGDQVKQHLEKKAKQLLRQERPRLFPEVRAGRPRKRY